MAIREKIQIEQNDRESLEDQAYSRIKEAILDKELRPGEKVSHTEWAEKLNISRTPVRDALKRLENEGLIIRETERIWHVYTLTIEDVYMIFDARIATDGKIAYLAAKNITPELIEKIEIILVEMEQTRLANDYDTFTRVNRKFHELLNRASCNPYLVHVNLLLHEKTSRLYPKGIDIDHRLEKGYQENLLIAQAIMEHDPEKAEYYQKKHILTYRDHLIRVLKELVIPYTGPEF